MEDERIMEKIMEEKKEPKKAKKLSFRERRLKVVNEWPDGAKKKKAIERILNN